MVFYQTFTFFKEIGAHRLIDLFLGRFSQNKKAYRLFMSNSVERRVLEHPNEQERVSEPIRRLRHTAHRAEHNFRVEHVSESRDHLTLDWQLLVHQRQIVLQFRVISDKDAFSVLVVLRTTGSTEHLHDIKSAEFSPAALFRVVDLGSLDDDGVRGKIDSPGKGGCREEHLQSME